MDAQILGKLIAKRIPPEQFQLRGLDVHWLDMAFDTPENRAIVQDVIANYDTLAVAFVLNRTAVEVRAHRDELLRCSDCKMLDDHPTGKKQEWVAYRHALRDVPDQPGFPDDVTWPTKPK